MRASRLDKISVGNAASVEKNGGIFRKAAYHTKGTGGGLVMAFIDEDDDGELPGMVMTKELVELIDGAFSGDFTVLVRPGIMKASIRSKNYDPSTIKFTSNHR